MWLHWGNNLQHLRLCQIYTATPNGWKRVSRAWKRKYHFKQRNARNSAILYSWMTFSPTVNEICIPRQWRRVQLMTHRGLQRRKCLQHNMNHTRWEHSFHNNDRCVNSSFFSLAIYYHFIICIHASIMHFSDDMREKVITPLKYVF